MSVGDGAVPEWRRRRELQSRNLTLGISRLILTRKTSLLG